MIIKLAKIRVENATRESGMTKIQNDFVNFRKNQELELTSEKMKVTHLEIELKRLEQTLFEKEELLCTSVAMADVEKLKLDNDSMKAKTKSFVDDVKALTEKLSKSEQRCSEADTNYHTNLKVC